MPDLPSPDWAERLFPAIGQPAFANGDGGKIQGPFVVMPEK
jgi:hypothetical protein